MHNMLVYVCVILEPVGSTATATAPAAVAGGGGGGKEGNAGATAAALFPCLIYYPGTYLG